MFGPSRMPPTPLQGDIDILNLAVSECLAGSVSSETIANCSHALGHLTANLRSLRDGSSLALLDFIDKIVPTTIKVFRATSVTSHTSEDFSRQTVVFLCFIYGMSREILTINRRWNAAAVLNIPDLLREMAVKGRPSDVRPLLSALIIVASGEKESQARLERSLLSRISWPLFSTENSFLLTTLKATLDGWCQCRPDDNSWTAVQYLDISEALTIAMSIQLEVMRRVNESERLLKSTYEVIKPCMNNCLNLDQRGGIIILAAASGIIKLCVEIQFAHVHSAIPFIDIAKKVVRTRQNQLSQIPSSSAPLEVSGDLADCVNITLVLCQFDRQLTDVVPIDLLVSLRRSLQWIMLSAWSLDAFPGSSPPCEKFRHDTHFCITSRPEILGTAYALLVREERSVYSCVQFLRMLVCSDMRTETKDRLVFATITQCDCTPLVAVAFVDIVSLLSRESTPSVMVAVRKLAETIAKEHNVVFLLVRIVVSLLQGEVFAHTRRRAMLLMTALAQTITERNDSTLGVRLPEESCTERDKKGLWWLLTEACSQILDQYSQDTAASNACVNLMASVVKSKDIGTREATREMTRKLPSLLLSKYFSTKSARSRRRHMAHLIVISDAMTNSVHDEASIHEFITALANSVTLNRSDTERLVSVLMLRCMLRCDLKLIGAALRSISAFMSADEARKHRFLPAARTAVLGAEVGRKEICILWFFEMFGISARGSERLTPQGYGLSF